MAKVAWTDSDRAGLLGSGPLARWLAPTSQSRLERIDTHRINDRSELVEGDPRDRLVERALTVSIAARGILEPLLLRPVDGGYELVQGGRRLRAARRLGLDVVPAIVRELSDAEVLIAGPWQALLRRGLRASEAPPVTARLLRAGLSTTEVCALVSAAPRLPEPTLAALPPPNRRRGVAA